MAGTQASHSGLMRGGGILFVYKGELMPYASHHTAPSTRWYYPSEGIRLNFPRQIDPLHCSWDVLRGQLLRQWSRLSPNELDAEGPNRERLARLIARKHGIAPKLVENYLHNFERTLPLL